MEVHSLRRRQFTFLGRQKPDKHTQDMVNILYRPCLAFPYKRHCVESQATKEWQPYERKEFTCRIEIADEDVGAHVQVLLVRRRLVHPEIQTKYCGFP